MAYQKLCGYCLEGTGQALPPLPQAHGQWQTPDCRHRGNRAGDVGLPVGDRTGGRAASGQLIGSHRFGRQLHGKKSQHDLHPCCASLGVGPRWGILEDNCVADADRRPLADRGSPGRTYGNAVSNPRIRVCQPSPQRSCLLRRATAICTGPSHSRCGSRSCA